ncbi:MAG: hypothetical protein Q8N56_02525 [bacterium]|nr:hypothetical protein [bacterium]
MKKNIKKKANPGNENLKTELKQIRTDLKKLKKSKKRMQLLWYRTKKEHVALIADLDKRLKVLKKRTAKKTARAKKSIMKPMRKKARARKQIKKEIIKKTWKNAAPAKKK